MNPRPVVIGAPAAPAGTAATAAAACAIALAYAAPCDLHLIRLGWRLTARDTGDAWRVALARPSAPSTPRNVN